MCVFHFFLLPCEIFQVAFTIWLVQTFPSSPPQLPSPCVPDRSYECGCVWLCLSLGTQKLGKEGEVSTCYVPPPAQFGDHRESKTSSLWPLPCFQSSVWILIFEGSGERGSTPLRKQTDRKGEARHRRDWEDGFGEVGGRGIGDFISRSLGKCT